MSVRFRFNGQAAYEVDTGTHKKIRVVFGMINEDRTQMAWYLFSSGGVAKSKLELKQDKMPPEEFGYRAVGGRDIPVLFDKDIGFEGLGIDPTGTFATLTLDASEKRFIACRLAKLKTKAKEVVTFPFGLQRRTDPLPSRLGTFNGKILFLETAPFDRDKFILGPQGHAKNFITGP